MHFDVVCSSTFFKMQIAQHYNVSSRFSVNAQSISPSEGTRSLLTGDPHSVHLGRLRYITELYDAYRLVR